MLEEKLLALEEELTLLLLPKDPNDDRDVMLEIRAGTGGDEASIFAGDLVNIYRKYADEKGWKVSTIDETKGTDGGYKTCIMNVKGDYVYSKLKWESGVHRVQRVSSPSTILFFLAYSII